MMKNRNKLSATTGYALAFVVAAVALLFMSCTAQAAGIRRNAAVCTTCAPRAVVHHVAKYQVAAAVPYVQPLWQVGQHMQRQAIDTNAFRHSQEYLEYLQLKGFQQGVASALQSGHQQQSQQQSPPQQERWSEPAQQPQEEQRPIPNPLPPMAPENVTPAPPSAGFRGSYNSATGEWIEASQAQPENVMPQQQQPQSDVEWFKQRYPTIATTCMGCHGGKDPDNPDGGLRLDGSVQIVGNNRYVDLTGREIALPLLILEKTFNNHMPPNKGVNDQTYSAIQDELLFELPEEGI